jgi:hypothetical protein
MKKFMSKNINCNGLNYSDMENESLIIKYILESGKYGLRSRSDLPKHFRNELKSRTILNYDSLTINTISEGIKKKLYRYNEINKKIIKSNLEDLLRFLPEDAKEGGNLLDIVAPSQNNI